MGTFSSHLIPMTRQVSTNVESSAHMLEAGTIARAETETALPLQEQNTFSYYRTILAQGFAFHLVCAEAQVGVLSPQLCRQNQAGRPELPTPGEECHPSSAPSIPLTHSTYLCGWRKVPWAFQLLCPKEVTTKPGELRCSKPQEASLCTVKSVFPHHPLQEKG